MIRVLELRYLFIVFLFVLLLVSSVSAIEWTSGVITEAHGKSITSGNTQSANVYKTYRAIINYTGVNITNVTRESSTAWDWFLIWNNSGTIIYSQYATFVGDVFTLPNGGYAFETNGTFWYGFGKNVSYTQRYGSAGQGAVHGTLMQWYSGSDATCTSVSVGDSSCINLLSLTDRYHNILSITYNNVATPLSVNITDPTNNDQRSVTYPQNSTINFTVKRGSTEITSGVSVNNISIGGTSAPVVTQNLTYDNASLGAPNGTFFSFQQPTGSGTVTNIGGAYYMDTDQGSGPAEMTLYTGGVKEDFTTVTFEATFDADLGNGRGYHSGIGTGTLFEQDFCNTNTGLSPDDGYAWCTINGGTDLVLYRLDNGVETSLDSATITDISGVQHNYTWVLNTSGVYVLIDGTTMVSSSDTTYSEGYLSISTGGGTSNRGSLTLYDVNYPNTHLYHLGSGLWQANVTIPNFASGTKDLFINISESGENTNDTEADAFDYGGGGDACAYGGSGDWVIDCSVCDQEVETGADIGGNDLLASGSGTVIISSAPTNYGVIRITEACIIRLT